MATFQAHDVIIEVNGERIPLGSPLSNVGIDATRRDSHGNLVVTMNCTPNPLFFERLGRIVNQAYSIPPEDADPWGNLFQSSAETEARRQAREGAGERAKTLLYQHLTEKQRTCLDAYGEFWVEGPERNFRLSPSDDAIEERDSEGELAAYCLTPEEWGLPKEDKFLAVLLMLRHAPEEFFAKANVLWRRGEDRNGTWRAWWEDRPQDGEVHDFALPASSDNLHPESTYREWFNRHFHQ